MTCRHYDYENALSHLVIVGNVRKLKDGVEGGLQCQMCGARFSWYHVTEALSSFGMRHPNALPKGMPRTA